MGLGTQTFPTIDPHSKIKHQIIDEYIQTYIDVLMRNQLMPELGLSIVDGFSGGGIYHDGVAGNHFGSPVIALGDSGFGGPQQPGAHQAAPHPVPALFRGCEAREHCLLAFSIGRAWSCSSAWPGCPPA